MLKRYEGNPILKPNSETGIFNPAAHYKNGKVHLFPRVIDKDEDYISKIGHYISDDGLCFEPASPCLIFCPGKQYDRWGCEDPRVVEIEGVVYFTYVALSKPARQSGGSLAATALLSTKDFRKFQRHGLITPRLSDNKDVVLFPEKINGRYVVLHRPLRWSKQWMDGNNNPRVKIPCFYEELPQKPAIWIAFSEDFKYWFGHKVVMESQEWWEENKIGGGAPPIKTEAGWLINYHGVTPGCYRAGAALLDLEDPSKVIGRTREPILEPVEEYENNIVFPEGNVVINGKLFVYYGAADKCVGLATCSLNVLLEELEKGVVK